MTLIGALLGVFITAGLVGVVAGLRRTELTTRRPTAKQTPGQRWATITRRPPGRAGRRRDRRLAASIACGLLAWLFTGWVLAVVIVPIAVFGLPSLLRDPDPHAVDRLSAVEQWTRSLKGLLTAGSGIEQAILVSLTSTPDLVRPEVEMLVARLSARWSIEDALYAFADDLNDETGDLIAMALIGGARLRGDGLGAILDNLATTISDIVRARRSQEAERAKPRATARYITLITVAVLGIATLNRHYMAPYTTPFGQMLLAVLLSAYVGCLIWMRRTVATKPNARLLTPRGSR